jgi:hypothetical protein
MAYRNDKHWAILIEDLGYHYKAGFPDGISSSIYAVGTGVKTHKMYLNGAHALKCPPLREWRIDVPPELKEVSIRGVPVPVPRNKADYQARGIRISDVSELGGQDLLRVLLPEHRDALLATEQELRRHLKPGLPFFLKLDAWHHPDLADDQLPSQSGTFPALAEALAFGDPNRFRLTRRPNTHWKHWPRGGGL